jgi:hypothetical protein
MGNHHCWSRRKRPLCTPHGENIRDGGLPASETSRMTRTGC